MLVSSDFSESIIKKNKNSESRLTRLVEECACLLNIERSVKVYMDLGHVRSSIKKCHILIIYCWITSIGIAFAYKN